ncbi:MAG: GNAT family N-acetyltransferase [Candidatus Hodarchaeota archaeon]
MRIKPLNVIIERSYIIDIWKQMWNHLMPEEPTLSEEEFDTLFAREDQTVLDRDFLIAKDNQGKAIGFTGLMKSSTRDYWRIMYIVLPEYIQSKLPGQLLDAIVNLANIQAASKLRFYSRENFILLNKKLKEMGIKPVQYGWWMRLDNFKSLSQSVVPPGIILKNQKDINNLSQYIAVYNEVHKNSFEFESHTEEKVNQFFNQKRNYLDIEHCFAFEGNKLVGMCYITSDPEKQVFGTINSVGVLPSYRHQGIGSALMMFGIQLLLEKKCKMIELSVMADNEQALALYKKLGFYKLDLRTQYIYEVLPSEYVNKL